MGVALSHPFLELFDTTDIGVFSPKDLLACGGANGANRHLGFRSVAFLIRTDVASAMNGQYLRMS